MRPPVKRDKIANELRARILGGILPPGGRIPAEQELAHQWNVARDTLRDALRILEEEGLIERLPGKGTFVRARTEKEPGNVVTFLLPCADILAVRGNVVPVGKDQLPHIEMTRTIARRFNKKFSPKAPFFEEPCALLSQTVSLMGLDGVQKMSKSRNNAIMLKATRDEIAQKVKKATTDCERFITYEPERRPQVANLLRLISVMDGRPAEQIASQIGEAGAKALKEMLVETACDFLRPIQEKRKMYEQEPGYVRSVLQKGIERAREEASKTLELTLRVMNMELL